jgi:hypothetical protein
MNKLSIAFFARSRRLLGVVGWIALILLGLALLPLVVHVVGRLADEFTSLLPQLNRLREESLWPY